MKSFILFLSLMAGIATTTLAQQNTQGDWYIGTGDISNTSWTEWALSPTVGYAFTDNLVTDLSLNQGTTADDTGATVADDLNIGVHVRYFFDDFFGYVGTQNLEDDSGLNVGVGRLFTTERNNLYLDPRVVFNTEDKTTNLRIGFGLKF